MGNTNCCSGISNEKLQEATFVDSPPQDKTEVENQETEQNENSRNGRIETENQGIRKGTSMS